MAIEELLESMGGDWEGEQEGPAESLSANLNVLLKRAREYENDPDAFHREQEALARLLEAAGSTLEQLYSENIGAQQEQMLEEGHHDLGELGLLVSELRPPLDNEELAAWKNEAEPMVRRLFSLQDRFEIMAAGIDCPGCGETLGPTQQHCPGCGFRRGPEQATDRGDAGLVQVSPDLLRLFQLCHRVAASGEDEELQAWEQQLEVVHRQFEGALEQLKRAGALLGKKLTELDPRLQAMGQMETGLDTLLEGVAQMSSFAEHGRVESLNQGWTVLLRGYREFKESGELLSRLK